MNIEKSELANAYLSLLKTKHLNNDLLKIIIQLVNNLENGKHCLLISNICQDLSLNEQQLKEALLNQEFVEQFAGCLFLKRYAQKEQKIANFIANNSFRNNLDKDLLKKIINKYFSPSNEINMQKIAVLQLLQFNFAVLTGGPGTGKTTTAVKILASLLEMEPNLKIALAAPTGKAAQRLLESINNAYANFDNLPENMPKTAATLHRLLGINNIYNRAKFNEDNKLNIDVLLIDEASMIDIQMFENIIDALSKGTKLILLGDDNQLPAIEPGALFAEICCNANQFDFENIQLINEICAINLSANNKHLKLNNNVVKLDKSYRFNDKSSLGRLATSVKDANTAQFLQELDNLDENCQFVDNLETTTIINELMQNYQALIDFCNSTYMENEKQIAQAFALYKKFNAVCALRKGVFGVDNLNKILDKKFSNHKNWYAGKVIIIKQNNYSYQLFNGDIGICLKTKNGLQVFFENENAFKIFKISQIPEFDVAFVLTVHQSQGSESEKIAVILPKESNVNRNLLYTAITRAKTSLLLISDEISLINAINNALSSETALLSRMI